MKVLLTILNLVFAFISFSQQVSRHEYDNANRLTQITYPNQKIIKYAYDKDGNRISQIISTIVTAVSNLNDSLIQANNGVFIYPNPSSGNFKSRIYSSKKQVVVLTIHTVEGKLINTYSVEVLKGYYDININISPKPAGTYIVTIKGETINASKQVIIGY